MGGRSRSAGQLRIPTRLCGTRGPLEVHDPAGGRPARAVLVLRAAGAAVPVLPPDPLEVVHLEDEEGEDPEEGLRLRHVSERIGAKRLGAMGRMTQMCRAGVPANVLHLIRDGAVTATSFT
jgi:hypothetical protein